MKGAIIYARIFKIIFRKSLLIHVNINFKKKSTDHYKTFLIYKKNLMSIYLFWILFFTLWGIVPLMIVKGRTDETPKLNTSPVISKKKKGWFN